MEKLVADVETISSNLSNLNSDVEDFSSAVSSFNGVSINCTLSEVSEILISYKDNISNELTKLDTSSNSFNNDLVKKCCEKYKANEDKITAIDVSKIDSIISSFAGGLSSGKTTEIMKMVADVARSSGRGEHGSCETWAEEVWVEATGLQRNYQGSAYEAWQNFGVSDSKDNIPVGAMVYGSGYFPIAGYDPYYNPYGHVAIYVGDGMVADPDYGVISFDEWNSLNIAYCDNGQSGYFGWGWYNNVDLSKM